MNKTKLFIYNAACLLACVLTFTSALAVEPINSPQQGISSPQAESTVIREQRESATFEEAIDKDTDPAYSAALPDDAGAVVIGTFPEQALDEDQDGVSDLDDNCPQTPKRMQTLMGIQPMQVDECGCPIDVCKLDQDHDGINDCQDKCIDTPADLEVDKAGCPKLVVQPQRFVLDVKFEFAKANIQGQFVDDLEALRALMVRYPKLTITLEGHTDNVGSDGYNQSLSQVRAQMCRRYLLSAGDIDPSRIQAVGFGESQPVASNRTEAGRAQNRRTLAVLNYQYAFNPLKKPSKPQ